MIICETQFDQRDWEHKDYSLSEVDYYAWIPFHRGIPNHRLSLRKNLKTGDYEVYRRFFMKLLAVKSSIFVFSGEDTGKEKVVFKDKELKEAIEFANGEVERYHGERETDVVCTHIEPMKSRHCVWSGM